MVIIFDFYDTLVQIQEETDPYSKCYFQYLSNKIPEDEYRRLVLTRPFSTFFDIAHFFGIQADGMLELEAALEKEIESIELFPEVVPVLETLSKRHKLYLFSNLATPYIQPFYALGIDRWIDQPFFSCEIGHIKPDRRAYEYIIKSISHDPSDMIMVGDSSQSDYLGPIAAGLSAIWLNRVEEDGDGYIRSLETVLEILD